MKTRETGSSRSNLQEFAEFHDTLPNLLTEMKGKTSGFWCGVKKQQRTDGDQGGMNAR